MREGNHALAERTERRIYKYDAEGGLEEKRQAENSLCDKVVLYLVFGVL